MGALKLALIALLLVACSKTTIDRAEWQRMSHDDRTLYVQSLIGGEQAKDAKGGGGKSYTRPPAEYVAGIEAAYARGDQRDAHEIFLELR